MDALLILLGLGLLGAGLIAVFRGSLPALRIPHRKAAALTMAAGLLAFVMGGALADPPATTPSADSSPTPTETAAAGTTSEPDRQFVLETPIDAQQGGGRPAGVPAEAQEATVVRHVDGDTFWAEGGTLPPGTSSRVRLLEVDTPESTTQTDCYGPDASAFTRAELPIGSKVYLLADRGDTDRFGRFLRYAWKSNGEFFNEKLARQGFARAVLIAPNDRYIGVMRSAESEARSARRGLWGACGAAAAAAPAPPPPRPPAAPAAPRPPAPPAPDAMQPPAAQTGCHPSYPDFCVAPPPPDLDCADIGRQLTVRQPDPHRLDGQPGQAGEPDGVGCESYP
ncbi:MAG TPA: thermonuclease family protein [Actinomycetota bacterium]|nr:thermonuclease family protein [Actinomycetota bacterium]